MVHKGERESKILDLPVNEQNSLHLRWYPSNSSDMPKAHRKLVSVAGFDCKSSQSLCAYPFTHPLHHFIQSEKNPPIHTLNTIGILLH